MILSYLRGLIFMALYPILPILPMPVIRLLGRI